MPGLVFKRSNAFLSGLQRLQSQAADAKIYLQKRLDHKGFKGDAKGRE